MKQILQDECLIGKTIKSTGYADNTYALFFEDETFAIFRGCGWDEKDVELMSDKFNLTPGQYNCDELLEIGIIDQEEHDKFWVGHHKKLKVEKEQEQRKLYEDLKAKFD